MSNSWDPKDYSLLGSSVLGIFQARILEWFAISFSRRSSRPRIEAGSLGLQADSLPTELPGCCWKRVFAMTSAFSWQNSISLCLASFCTSRPNLPVTPGISWLPTFAFQSPIMKRTSFGGVSSRRSWGLHRTVQLQFLQRYWLGHRIGLQ